VEVQRLTPAKGHTIPHATPITHHLSTTYHIPINTKIFFKRYTRACDASRAEKGAMTNEGALGGADMKYTIRNELPMAWLIF
jgi:hypothetical protein